MAAQVDTKLNDNDNVWQKKLSAIYGKLCGVVGESL